MDRVRRGRRQPFATNCIGKTVADLRAEARSTEIPRAHLRHPDEAASRVGEGNWPRCEPSWRAGPTGPRCSTPRRRMIPTAGTCRPRPASTCGVRTYADTTSFLGGQVKEIAVEHHCIGQVFPQNVVMAGPVVSSPRRRQATGSAGGGAVGSGARPRSAAVTGSARTAVPKRPVSAAGSISARGPRWAGLAGAAGADMVAAGRHKPLRCYAEQSHRPTLDPDQHPTRPEGIRTLANPADHRREDSAPTPTPPPLARNPMMGPPPPKPMRGLIHTNGPVGCVEVRPAGKTQARWEGMRPESARW